MSQELNDHSIETLRSLYFIGREIIKSEQPEEEQEKWADTVIQYLPEDLRASFQDIPLFEDKVAWLSSYTDQASECPAQPA